MKKIFSIDLSGMERNAKRLARLSLREQSNVLAAGMKKTMEIPARKAKALVRVRYGNLKKALGTKAYASKSKDVIIGIVGPRRGKYADAKPLRRGKDEESEDYNARTKGTEQPSRYAHLVEKGHKGPRAAPAYPFLEPAFNASKGSMTDDLARHVAKAIENEAKKLT